MNLKLLLGAGPPPLLALPSPRLFLFASSAGVLAGVRSAESRRCRGRCWRKLLSL